MHGVSEIGLIVSFFHIAFGLASLKPGLRIDTSHGPVRGVVDEDLGVNVWWGVPFAAPPIGSLRFAPPIPPKPWSAEHFAGKPPPLCPQVHLTKNTFMGQEDCLYLDVYRQTNISMSEQLPVLFWIYGGAFFIGDSESSLNPVSSTYGWYDGRRFAAHRPLIIVSVNYRLGNMGFLALPSLLHEHKTAGNWGLLDQQLGMRWVQENIQRFGGDKGRVMICGQSAGAMSVTAHMAMPTSKGLFHSAVAMSTVAAGTMAYTPWYEAANMGELFATDVGCSNKSGDVAQVSCLRNLSLSDAMSPLLNFVSKHWHDIGSKSLPMLFPLLPWWTVVDGSPAGLPIEPITAVRDKNYFFNDVPLITGNMRDEGSLFTASLKFMPRFVSRLSVKELMTHWYNETLASAFIDEYDANGKPEVALSLYLRDAWFVCSTRAWLRAIRERREATGSKHPSFWYMFNATMDHDFMYTMFGDYHTGDLSYIWDNPWLIHRTEPPFTWSESDKRLSMEMQFYWSQHAASGNPNSAECGKYDGCVSWPEYDESEYRISLNEKQLVIAQGVEDWGGEHPAPKCDFWDKWGYDQPRAEAIASFLI